MGASVTGSDIRGRKTGRRRYAPMAEINVTPFVDVMLVLLIIFMVAAPLLTAGVAVDLPKAKAKPLAQDSKPLEVSMDQKGAIFLADTAITVEELGPRLKAISENRMDTRIYIRADRTLDYGDVMEVVGTINSAGFTKVALIADPSKK
ncbi:protein TolR [Gimibacter soli]|uniref:Protein TolR n=1 Tax=Gimibacter soli TaxID=3024400 RepID=A0AAF0BIG1_9PROT|nr:protein TolR [Gimibacter soli]WCL55363.1 protein TolR [Gimibacter soli]